MGLFDKIFGKKPGKGVDLSQPDSRLMELSAKFPFPLIAIPGNNVETELLRLRNNLSSPHGVPVAVGSYENAARLLEIRDDPFDFDSQLKLAASINAEEWFTKRRAEDPELYTDDGQDEVHLSGTAPMSKLTIGCDYKNIPHAEVFIAIVPTSDSTTLPLHLRFGDWNDCPSPCVHTAVARYWRERYGAEIATVAPDVIEFTVAKLPPNDEEALQLAWQQYFYCSDIVDQGVGSVATLAQALRTSSRWFFWWD